ncbi:MAG: CRISPR-associated endonuclease Cas1 [Candidatus Aenigmarchaeota archaeon]|nr:CRISPR-associated endonuclease Cas1 [Candidatus Aenigmarchaeota archaeon]
MQLIIDQFGMFLGKKGSRFILKDGNEKKEVAAENVSQIIISTASSISTNAIRLAIEYGIDIVYTNYFGMPYARTYPCKLGGTTLTRRMQATKYPSIKMADCVKSVVEAKVRNQIYMLKSLQKTRENINFEDSVNSMEKLLEKLPDMEGSIDEIREDLLGIEGYAGNQYFYCLSQILPFKEREHKAKDPFNAMLNYGYGMLYSEVEKACILAGLDPFLGFLHTDRYGKPSMVLDFIEEFRQPIVDRAVITLFVRKQVDEEKDFEGISNVLILSKSGKEKVVKAVMERLHTKIEFRGKKVSFSSIVKRQARLFVKVLLGEKDKYEPFIYRW